MAIDLLSSYESDHEDDDFIDMEVGLFTSNLFAHSVPFPHHQNQNPREFEFHMSSKSTEARPTSSPADELFYNGKLLPMYPPRLQMVEKILHSSNPALHNDMAHLQFADSNEELYSTPMLTKTTPTPFESCNVSPSESCRVSRELNPEEHLFDYSETEAGDSNCNVNADFAGDHHSEKKSWTRKIWLIKQSSLSSKLKASRAYLKSLFGMSDHSKATADHSDLKSPKRSLSSKPEKLLKDQSSSEVDKKVDNINGGHRRSFSVSIKRHSSNKVSSSSSSSSKNPSKKPDGFGEVQLLKRSSSANSGIESPIQGAIAHCKRSHQHFFSSRKTLREAGFHSFSASRLSISEDQEKLNSLCRG